MSKCCQRSFCQAVRHVYLAQVESKILQERTVTATSSYIAPLSCNRNVHQRKSTIWRFFHLEFFCSRISLRALFISFNLELPNAPRHMVISRAPPKFVFLQFRAFPISIFLWPYYSITNFSSSFGTLFQNSRFLPSIRRPFKDCLRRKSVGRLFPTSVNRLFFLPTHIDITQGFSSDSRRHRQRWSWLWPSSQTRVFVFFYELFRQEIHRYPKAPQRKGLHYSKLLARTQTFFVSQNISMLAWEL